MALPSGATNCAPLLLTVPSASATPGTLRTVVTMDCGMLLRSAPPPPVLLVKAAWARTWKSTFW